MVIKAEVVYSSGRELKGNERFVLTNWNRMEPENVYRWYCGQGDSENRIKELKHDLANDRTICNRFVANHFHVLLTASAFVFFQEPCWRLRNTKAARATLGELRRMLLEIEVRVVTSCRLIVSHFPTHMPWADVRQEAACASGANFT